LTTLASRASHFDRLNAPHFDRLNAPHRIASQHGLLKLFYPQMTQMGTKGFVYLSLSTKGAHFSAAAGAERIFHQKKSAPKKRSA